MKKEFLGLLCLGSFCLSSAARAGSWTQPFEPDTGFQPHMFEQLSCAQLYHEIYRRVPDTYAKQPGFLDDPRNRLIGSIGLMAPPVWSLFALTAASAILQEERIENAEKEVTVLRQISAQKNCWVRE